MFKTSRVDIDAYTGNTNPYIVNILRAIIKSKPKNQKRNVITARTTEKERAEILKAKEITPASYRGQADARIALERTTIESNKKALITAAIRRTVEEFGLPKSIENKDMNLNIEVHFGAFEESVSKGSNSEMLIKLTPILNKAVENAIGIEVHQNRYYADNNTTFFTNLLGCVEDGEYLIPIRFGVKSLTTGKNFLYIVFGNEKINKAKVVMPGRQRKTAGPSTHSASIIKIARLASKVNTKDILRLERKTI